MRALPRSSFTRRTTCARITCEPARKARRGATIEQAFSSGEPGKHSFYDVARARFAEPCKLHLAKSHDMLHPIRSRARR